MTKHRVRRLCYYGLLEDLYPEAVPLFAIHPDMPYERILRQDDRENDWRDVRCTSESLEFEARRLRAESARLRAQQKAERADELAWRRLRKRAEEVTPTPPVSIIPWVGSTAEELWAAQL